ncbi:MAG: DUF1990 domain-containing protein [Nakamurella sp.]
MPPLPLTAGRAAILRAASFSYDQVGQTSGRHPAGFRSFTRTIQLPAGTDFDRASDDLLHWQLQRRAGVRVVASAEVVEPGVQADLLLGVGRLSVRAPVRIVYVINEPTRRGFAYGTLPGHPESGEEAFVLSLTATGGIELSVSAFSRHAGWLSRLAGPLGHWLQHVITNRYLRRFAAAYQ